MSEKPAELWEFVIKDMAEQKSASEEIEETLLKYDMTERELLLAVWEKVRS